MSRRCLSPLPTLTPPAALPIVVPTLALIALMGLTPYNPYHSHPTALLAHSEPAHSENVDRSPIDLALSIDGRWALTANATSDSVSLVDMTGGKVVVERPIGKRPFAIALSRNGKRAVVTNQWADIVTVLEVSPSALRIVGTIAVGDEPRGVALSSDGSQAYVALAGEDRLAFVDLNAQKVTARLPVGSEPWHVAVSSDGKTLAVGNARSQDLSVVDIARRRIAYEVKLRGHNVRHVAFAPDNAWVYVPNIAERGRPATKENIDRGWVVGNRLSRVPMQEEGPREAIALDPRGQAVGDLDGVAVSPDGDTLAVTAAGTHELLLLRQPLPFIAFGGPGDHIEPDLLADARRFRRVPVGGRPMGVAFAPDGHSVVLANYLSSCLQVVDVETARIVRTIALGGAPTPSPARRGEALFTDATRSFHHWYSCSTCHVEGHTNGSNFDTFNDGSYGTPKKTLSLRGVAQTGPWTWHGWQKSLRQLVHDSMTTTMQGPEPTEDELDALLAYLDTLDFKPNPRRAPGAPQNEAARRGEKIFQAKACANCHTPPLYTHDGAFLVGLESSDDVYKGFNPPSLCGVYNRSPYLHDGRARTLEEVLTLYHRPSQLTNTPDLRPDELRDLIAFLQTL